MGLCTVGEGGPDVCQTNDFNSSTEKHTKCYVGTEDCDDSGGLEGQDCDVGCQHCVDDPKPEPGVAREGPRWMRADANDPMCRDARGLIQDMGTGMPRLIRGLGIKFVRGACFKQDIATPESPMGEECFGDNACECFPPPKVDVGAQTCDGGELVGEPLKGLHPDEFYYQGSNWKPAIICRSFATTPNQDQLITLAPEELSSGPPMYPPVFARTGWHELSYGPNCATMVNTSGGLACADNYLIPCTGRIPASLCDHFVGNPDRIGGFYELDSNKRGIWDEARIVDNTMRIRSDGKVRVPPAEAALRNLVLDVVKTTAFPGGPLGIRFDRLVHGVLGGSGNAELCRWSHIWEGDTLANLPDVVTLPDCYTLLSGCPVQAVLKIWRVLFILHFVPLKVVKYFTPPGVPMELGDAQPFARVRVFANCAVEATFPEGCGSLSIVHGALGTKPRITGGEDRIVYRHAGSTVEIPWLVEWRGMLGHFSSPATATVNGGSCEDVARNLGDIVIPAAPYLRESEPNDPNQLYGGEVTISFVR